MLAMLAHRCVRSGHAIRASELDYRDVGARTEAVRSDCNRPTPSPSPTPVPSGRRGKCDVYPNGNPDSIGRFDALLLQRSHSGRELRIAGGMQWYCSEFHRPPDSSHHGAMHLPVVWSQMPLASPHASRCAHARSATAVRTIVTPMIANQTRSWRSSIVNASTLPRQRPQRPRREAREHGDSEAHAVAQRRQAPAQDRDLPGHQAV